MKKSILYLLAGLALGLTACDDKSDLGTMQVNPQEPIVSTEGWAVTLQPGVTDNSKIDLNNYSDPQEIIPLLTVTTPDDLPADYNVEVLAYVSKDDQFVEAASQTANILLEKENGVYGISAENWSTLFRQLYGKAPYAEENVLRFAIFVQSGNQLNRVGGFFETTTLEVTPIDLNINVESTYYLLVTSLGDGTLQSAIQMNHNAETNQYDDPTFTVSVDIPETEGGYKWYIVPQSAYENNDPSSFFTAEDPQLFSGNLVLGEAQNCNIFGNWVFSINMDPENSATPTYDIVMALEFLYTPWGARNQGFVLGKLKTDDFDNYYGYSHLSTKGFQFTGSPNYTGRVWGAPTDGDVEGKMQLQATGEQLEYLKTGITEAGLYWVTAKLSTLTYNTLYLEKVSVIGNLSEDNNWATDIELTPSSDFYTWTGEVTFEVPNGEWKFRTNNAWNNGKEGAEYIEYPNLGAKNTDEPYVDLVNNGANLPIPVDGVGTYTVTLNLSSLPYSCTLVKKN